MRSRLCEVPLFLSRSRRVRKVRLFSSNGWRALLFGRPPDFKPRSFGDVRDRSASRIGRLGSSTFRLSTAAASTSDRGVLDRNVQSSKIIHAALLLLMLEAANTDLVSHVSG